MSSIMDFFRSAPAPAAPAAAPATNQSGQNQPAAQSSQTAGASPTNPTVPEGTDTAGAAQSPLANYADLWKIDPNAAKEKDPLFNIDPAKLQAAAAQTDFSQVITPELRQKLASGGEDAVMATIEAMNKVAQANYAHSALATTKIVEQAIDKVSASYETRMQELIKQNQVSNGIRGENPLLSNPAVAPLISAMEKQFMQKYPNAPAADITKMAKEYMLGVSQLFAPETKTANTDGKTGANEYDWSTFLK